MKKIILNLAFVLAGTFFAGTVSIAQSFTVGGKVLDAQSGEAVVGATVMIKGTSRGVPVSADGSYSINVEAGDVLSCMCIGYSNEEAVVGKASVIDFRLKVDAEMLEETVVVGYGTLKKSQLVGSVESISGKELEDRVNSNVTRSLQGQVPGLNIIQTDGKPTHGGQIYVRGGATSYVSQTKTGGLQKHEVGQGGSALVLIDGVEGDLSLVNPDDIETISVLKDASSSVIYGARAAYGVILVTTKNMREDKVSVSYNGSFSINTRTVKWEDNVIDDGLEYVETFYDFWKGFSATPTQEGQDPTKMNIYKIPTNYLDLYREWAASGEGPKQELIDGSYVYFGGNYNYLEMFYKRFNTTQTHNLSVSGHSGRVSYSISGRYYGQDGIYRIGNEKYDNWNLRAKISVRATDHLTVDSNTAYHSMNYSQPIFSKTGSVGSQLWQIGVMGLPVVPPVNEDGTYSVAGAAGGYAAFNDGNSAQDQIKSTFTTTLGLTYEPFKDVFKIRADFSYKNATNATELYLAPVKYSTAPNTLTDYVVQSQSFKKRSDYKTSHITANVVGTYTPKLGPDHNLNVVLGWNLENYDHSMVSIHRTGIIYPSNPNFELMDGTEVALEENGSSYGLVGFFGRANYTLLSRYIFELSARYDGSSKFPLKQQWGFFPSASVGWRVSEEPWMKGTRNWLDNFKIRANAGSLGNGTIAPYTFLTTMGMYKTNTVVDGEFANKVSDPAVVPDNLTWEKVTTYDIGLDLDFLKNRLSFSGDYYVRNTTDLYINGPEIPAIFGDRSPKGNYGALQTRGWELTLSWRDSFKLGSKDFNYSIKGSLWDSRTSVTSYNNVSGDIFDYYEGKELGEIWGFRTGGYFLSNEEAAAWYPDEFHKSQPASGPYAGDLKFLDLDNTKTINGGDWTLDNHGDLERIGNMLPRFQYGLNLDFKWNGIGLSLFFQGVGKRDWYPSIGTDLFWGGYSRAYCAYVLKTQAGDNYVHLDKSTENWKVENPGAYWPRRAYNQATNTTGTFVFANDYFLQNAAYLRLKNLTVDYTFPSKWMSKAKIEKLRIYLSCENLFTWSPMFRHTSMFDPEVIVKGDSDFTSLSTNTSLGDGYSYPMLQTFTIGLNLTF